MSIPLGHIIQFDRADLLSYRDLSRDHLEFDLRVDDPPAASIEMGPSPDPKRPRTVLTCRIPGPGTSGTNTEAALWGRIRTAYHGANPADNGGSASEVVVALKVRYATADGQDWLTPVRILEMVQIDDADDRRLVTIGLMADGVGGARLTIVLGNENLATAPVGITRLTQDAWHTIAVRYRADVADGYCRVSVDGLIAAYRTHGDGSPVARVELAKIALRGGPVASAHYPMRLDYEYSGLLGAREFDAVYGGDDRNLDIWAPLAGIGHGSIRSDRAVICFAEEAGHFDHGWSTSDLDWRIEYADNPDFLGGLSSATSTARFTDQWWDFLTLGGLEPDTIYFYRAVVSRAGFPDDARTAPERRLRTLPEHGAVSVGFAFCQDQAAGQPFSIYGHLADRNVACAIGLGDFIYNDSQESANTGPHAEVGGFLREYKLAFDLETIRYMHQGHLLPAIPSDHDWENAIHRGSVGAYSRGYGPDGVRDEYAAGTIGGLDGSGYSDGLCQNAELRRRGVTRRVLWDAAREAMYRGRGRGLLGAVRMAKSPPANPWEDTEYFDAFDAGEAHYVLVDCRSFQDFDSGGGEWFNQTGEACFLGRHLENLLKAHLLTVDRRVIVICLDPVWGDVYAGLDNPHSFARQQRHDLERWMDDNLPATTRVVFVCGDRHVRFAHSRFGAEQSGRTSAFARGFLEVSFGQASKEMFTLKNEITEGVLFDDQDGMIPGEGQWGRFGGVLTVTDSVVWAEFIGSEGDNQGVVARHYRVPAESRR